MHRAFRHVSIVATRLAAFAVVAALLSYAGAVPALVAAEKTAAKAAEGTWQVIYLGGQRIGYAHSMMKTIERGGREIVRTSEETHLTLKRGGSKLRMQVKVTIDETEEGRMLSFVQEVNNPPISAVRTEGRIRGNKLLLKTESGLAAKTTSTREVDWDPEAKSPGWQDRVLASNPVQPGQTRSFKMYSADLNKIVTVKITGEGREKVAVFGGQTRTLNALTVSMDVPGLPDVTIYVDENGKAVKEEMVLLGLPMAVYTVSREEALKEIAGEEFDLLVSSLVKVDPLTAGHGTEKVVYRITVPDEDPSEFFPDGNTQSVRRIADDVIELTVTAAPFPKNPRTVAAGPEYLAGTKYLQCTNRRVVELAEQAAGDETDASKVARRMEKFVYRKLSSKNFSTAMATAAEVARSLEGDCTEHAVLLAAMLRAKQIPSRIAVGLVYIEGRGAFGGHMWTEAWLDGRWIPLDATLGRGGIGAAHLKMVESSFSDDGPAPVLAFFPMMQVLSKIKIEIVAAE